VNNWKQTVPLTRDQERASWDGDRCLHCGYTINMSNLTNQDSRARWRTYCKARHTAKHLPAAVRPPESGDMPKETK
jgi:hypothetical protein